MLFDTWGKGDDEVSREIPALLSGMAYHLTDHPYFSAQLFVALWRKIAAGVAEFYFASLVRPLWLGLPNNNKAKDQCIKNSLQIWKGVAATIPPRKTRRATQATQQPWIRLHLPAALARFFVFRDSDLPSSTSPSQLDTSSKTTRATP